MSRSVFTETYERFCQELIQARKAAGLTQAELAARLSRPQSFVSKYERGERRIDVVEFLEIADALEMDAGELIRRLRPD
jgi:transcriptional regulator with XRE-family HTH domain